ncbi:unnamed protein product, partial [Timema podura]|nr:unnamed protein product [Timema podura]
MYDFTYSSATVGDGLGPMYFFWRRRRYMVAMLAFFGFFNVYALRVNFSVAIVAMTSNRTVKENGTIVEYMYFWFGISLSPVSKIAERHQMMITSSLADAYYECPEEGERDPCVLANLFQGKQCPLPPWFHHHCANLVTVYKNDLQRSLRNELIQFAAQVLNMKEIYKDSFKVNALSAFTGPEFDWDSKTQGLLLSSFFFGYICTQILGGWLASRVGGNKVYGIGIAATSILTIVMPAVTYFPDHAVIPMIILVRVVEGLFEGVTYPCIHAVWARWAPPLERSRMASLAFAGSYVGTVVSLPICGILANELGWPSIFYVFGVVGLIWFIIWMYVVKEGPEMDPKISPQELDYLQNILGQTDKNLVHPWRKFFTSMPVWAVIVAHFCENWGFYTLLTQLPTFMKDALEFNLKKAGFMSALPYLVMAIVLSFSGQLADYLITNKYLNTSQINCMRYEAMTGGFSVKQRLDRFPPLEKKIVYTCSFEDILQEVWAKYSHHFIVCDNNFLWQENIFTSLRHQNIRDFDFVIKGYKYIQNVLKICSNRNVRKLFTCSAFMGQAVFMLMTCFLLTPTGAVSCLTAAVGLGAFAWSGFSVNHLDIAPQHASVLMGLSNTMATLPGIISPSITGILVQNK